MKLFFSKMHGLGNDFMVVNALSQSFTPSSELIKTWSDRHRGIGFDQLLLVEAPTEPTFDFNYRIFNANGGEVGQCGNGARCLARFIAEENLSQKKSLRVKTLSSALTLELLDDGKVSVQMGIPSLRPETIPFIAEPESLTYDLNIGHKTISIGALSLGNPHAVLEVPSTKEAPVSTWGPLIGQHARFPEGVNVGFMEIINPTRVRLRVYERGAGETQACGSGACAAVVFGRLQEKLAPQVTVELLGGDLEVRWHQRNDSVEMIGPAVTVFKGIIEYETSRYSTQA